MIALVLVGALVQDAYTQEIDAWHTKRVERLTSETGWLSLAGLFWLHPGDNAVGSDPKNELVFPAKAPRFFGTLTLSGKQVHLKVNPGQTATSGGRAVTGLDLVSDAAETPTLIELGTLSFLVIERGDKIGVRLRDKESPARKTFKGLERFSVDPAWRFDARFEPYPAGKTVAVPTVLGTIEEQACPGAIVFTVKGATHRLDAVQEPGETELFVIFADQTNGKETYGPGRFVYAPAPKDGKTVLDLNKAYNPPCAFTPFATCPLPPPQNRLPLRVTAGEKKYDGGH